WDEQVVPGERVDVVLGADELGREDDVVLVERQVERREDRSRHEGGEADDPGEEVEIALHRLAPTERAHRRAHHTAVAGVRGASPWRVRDSAGAGAWGCHPRQFLPLS